MRKIAFAALAGGGDIEITLYPGATHGFARRQASKQ